MNTGQLFLTNHSSVSQGHFKIEVNMQHAAVVLACIGLANGACVVVLLASVTCCSHLQWE